MSQFRIAMVAGAFAATLVVACGSPAQPSAATASATVAAATASPTPVATSAVPVAAQGAITWTLSAEKSKASVRVREQLARLPAPNDAVLTTALTGSFTLNVDGSFASTSKLTADMAALKSDSDQRDNFVKQSTLQVSRFPSAVFVPVKATGLTTPLPASGDFTFKIAGKLTIHGVEKDATFDVKATRTGATLTATATLNPTFKFGDFGMTPPTAQVVLSVVDELKMDVELSGIETK